MMTCLFDLTFLSNDADLTFLSNDADFELFCLDHGIEQDEADGFKLKPNDGQLVVGEYTVAGKLTKTPEVVGNILIADPKYSYLNCFFDKESESTQPLNAIKGFKNDGEWVLVRGTMDSGRVRVWHLQRCAPLIRFGKAQVRNVDNSIPLRQMMKSQI